MRLDDAFFHRQPGVSASTRLAVGLSLVLGLGAVYAFTCERSKDEHTQ